MSKFTHATIVPLIGGQAIGQMNAFNSDLDYILSYKPFAANDSQFTNWLEQQGKQVPYHVINNEVHIPPGYVDVVCSTCPCAGLSRLNPHASSGATANDWMYQSTQYILEWIQPQVLWGENAPGLVEKMGRPVLKRLMEIGKHFGYTLTTYRTKTVLHGYPQVRNRSFYFFLKGTNCVKLPFFNRPLIKTARDTILDVEDRDPQCHNERKPTDEFFYNAILHLKGMTHGEYMKHIQENNKSITARNSESRMVFLKEYSYDDALAHVERNGERFAHYKDKLIRMRDKEASGKGVMYSGVFFPIDYVGAFIGRHIYALAHPVEDRFISVKESMAMMSMPSDYELLGGPSKANMICQNVPVGTATDMAIAIKDYLEGKLETIKTEYLHCHNVKQTYTTENEKIDTHTLF